MVPVGELLLSMPMHAEASSTRQMTVLALSMLQKKIVQEKIGKLVSEQPACSVTVTGDLSPLLAHLSVTSITR